MLKILSDSTSLHFNLGWSGSLSWQCMDIFGRDPIKMFSFVQIKLADHSTVLHVWNAHAYFLGKFSEQQFYLKTFNKKYDM